jgi:hypothetical protein
VEAAVLDQDLVDKDLRMHLTCMVKAGMVETLMHYYILVALMEIAVL